MATASADRDASSLSNPHVAAVSHLSWSADVNFEEHVINATATYDVKIVAGDDSSPSLWLDTRGLSIESVQVDGSDASWKLEAAVSGKPHLGRRLVVPLDAVNACKVTIIYSTSSDPSECTAAQWLPPSQTAGKVHPYLFTQCQAIHARSLVPIQDLPGTKFTYDAAITCPSWATAVCSALPTEVKAVHRGKKSHAAGRKVCTFHQPVPIPSYLLALAVGDLASSDVSPRCRIYTEPCVLEAAAYEFSQTEDFLQAAEDLTGIEYPWGRYDLLVLPPSFPYGGMENPCLTFVTPTLLAGDRSLADVVAHEISHSWTGNLITNKTWGHFWLNEGWTTWLQRKIMSHPKISDPSKAAGVYGLDALGGWKHLMDDVALHPEEDTKLVMTLGDGDPDDSYSGVPYEKGFNLLHCLEVLVGADAFMGFAKAYIDKFKYGTVTSDEFRALFGEYFEDKEEATAAANFDWDAWLYGTGMPPNPYDPKFDRSLAEDAEALAKSWLDCDAGGAAPSDGNAISSWSTGQKTWFLDVVLTAIEERSVPLKAETVAAMQEVYGFQESRNAEILFRFLMLGVPTAEAGSEMLHIATRFITTQGRMKYVRPLYRTLRDSGEQSRALAIDTFLANQDFYHPIATKMLASDLVMSDSKRSPDRLKKLLLLGAAAIAAAAVTLSLMRGKRR